MWFLRWLLLAFLFVALLFFGFQNAGIAVKDMRFGTLVFPETPILLVIIAAFLLGLIVMFIIASLEYFRLSSRLRSVVRERDELAQHVDSFRQYPLDQIDEALDAVSEPSSQPKSGA